tara:strand:+ start:743 stop:1540 length:798 start_codon:yes stop_codon:yes gene_type:complete
MSKGITSLIPSDKMEDELQMEREARAAVAKRLNLPSLDLPAARNELPSMPTITFKSDFLQPVKSKEEVKKEKFDRYMDKEYGHEAIKKDVLKQVYQNKKAGKAPYENMSTSSIIVAETVKDAAKAKLAKLKGPSIEQQVINYSPVKVQPKNQKKFRGLKGGITVDSEHPDGFRINDDKDLYDVYGKDTTRYIQELTYKYDGIPIKETVKQFDSMDPSSFPSDPKQQAALSTYGRAYDRLTPLQKKQIENNNNKNKLFQNILPLKK